MSDIRPKLILRTGANVSEKSPSPAAKLMLNHGKPNFTINRSKSKIDSQSPTTPSTPEASQVVLKSTTFNGFIKPTALNLSTENEVNKVVLRRTRLPEASDRPVQDDEPEFIKAQRKIAERLAKENNLDFENRKSGYFTHVMMSPTSATKTMDLPVIEKTKIQKASVLDTADVTETPEETSKPTEAPVQLPKPTEVVETVQENFQATIVEPTQNGHENADLIQLNGTSGDEEHPTEVVQAAKALVEEVVQNVSEEIPPAKPVQNGIIQNDNQNAVENGESHSQENGHVAISTQAEPETVTKEGESANKDLELIQEMSKLKFDINADTEDVKVTPVLRATE